MEICPENVRRHRIFKVMSGSKLAFHDSLIKRAFSLLTLVLDGKLCEEEQEEMGSIYEDLITPRLSITSGELFLESMRNTVNN